LTPQLNTKLTIDEPREIELARISEARIMEKGVALNNQRCKATSIRPLSSETLSHYWKFVNFVSDTFYHK